MGKYAKDLDEALVKKVKECADKCDLSKVVTVEAIRLKRAKNNIGEIVKGNDLVQMYTDNDNIVAVALFEEAFDLVDEPTQDMWIEGLISQVAYDYEKEKMSIVKPEIQITQGMYEKYGQTAVDKARLAVLTVQQIREKHEEEKAMTKQNRKKQ